MIDQAEFFESTNNLLDKRKTGQCRGGVLYSRLATLRPGRFYLLGFNPGGSADDPQAPTLEQDLLTLQRDERPNAYVEEQWGPHTCGQAPFQKRVKALAEVLGANVEDICASNLIFVKSSRAHEVAYPALATECWPVHQLIMKIDSPYVILSIGNGARSAYGYIRNGLASGVDDIVSIESKKAEYGKWLLKACKCCISGRQTIVIGLPHFSYYPLDNAKYSSVVDGWLKMLL